MIAHRLVEDLALAVLVFLCAWRAGFVAGLAVGARREAAQWRQRFWR